MLARKRPGAAESADSAAFKRALQVFGESTERAKSSRNVTLKETIDDLVKEVRQKQDKARDDSVD